MWLFILHHEDSGAVRFLTGVLRGCREDRDPLSDDLHDLAIGFERRVRREQHERFRECLGDQQAIERVLMVPRQGCHPRSVRAGDGQLDDATRVDRARDRDGVCLELAQANFARRESCVFAS